MCTVLLSLVGAKSAMLVAAALCLFDRGSASALGEALLLEAKAGQVISFFNIDDGPRAAAAMWSRGHACMRQGGWPRIFQLSFFI